MRLKYFIGKDVLKINWRRLPVNDQRIYEAFECAILDVVGKIAGVPAATSFSVADTETMLIVMGWTGRSEPPKMPPKRLMMRCNWDTRYLKFKCSDEDPVRYWTEEIRKKCGDGIKIILDPNQRWKNVETTLRLMHDVDKDIMLGLEDPIEHSDVKGYKFLREKLGIPMYRHISLPYTQDIRDIIAFVKEDAVDGYNFNGSAYNSVLLAEIAHLEGKPCWRGSKWILVYLKQWHCILRLRVLIVQFLLIYSENL